MQKEIPFHKLTVDNEELEEITDEEFKKRI